MSSLKGKLLQQLYTIQHGRDLETWHLEAGRHLGTSEADTEVGVLLIQIPTRIPEKIVVALFSGVLVNSGIQVEAGRL